MESRLARGNSAQGVHRDEEIKQVTEFIGKMEWGLGGVEGIFGICVYFAYFILGFG